jgi:hypothetical protein
MECASVVAEDRAFYLLEKSGLVAHTLPDSHQTILILYVTFYLSFACNSTVPEIPYSRSTCNPAGDDNSDRVVAVKTVAWTDGGPGRGLS